MKTTFKIAALFIAIVALTLGCKKDPTNDPSTCHVVFDANGGSGTMQTQTFTKGNAQALTANAFTYEYHEFLGWNTAKDGSGTAYTNGQEVTLTEDIILYAQWSLNNLVNGHAWVDLGLPSGTLWATCNVGANTPEDYGDYFAWGETMTKTWYFAGTYRWIDNGGYIKYCNSSYYGTPDTLRTLVPTDDAATAHWGNCWRMPTREEIVELRDNYSTAIWTTQNGVGGFLVTGPNGNAIFLPATGERYEDQLYGDGEMGNYWSASLINEGAPLSPEGAWNILFNSGDPVGHFGLGGHERVYGLTVRPVCAFKK